METDRERPLKKQMELLKKYRFNKIYKHKILQVVII